MPMPCPSFSTTRQPKYPSFRPSCGPLEAILESIFLVVVVVQTSAAQPLKAPSSYVSVVLLLTGIISSRFGLWLADLSVNQVLSLPVLSVPATEQFQQLV